MTTTPPTPAEAEAGRRDNVASLMAKLSENGGKTLDFLISQLHVRSYAEATVGAHNGRGAFDEAAEVLKCQGWHVHVGFIPGRWDYPRRVRHSADQYFITVWK